MSSETGILGAFHATLQTVRNPKKNSKNPHFGSEYADLTALLDVIKPALFENGLAFYQPYRDGCLCLVLTDGKDEMVVEEMPLALSGNAQQRGSAFTYERRYQLARCFSLAAEDDGGNAAAEAPDFVTAAKKVASDYLKGKAAAYEALFGEKPDVGKPSSIADCYRKAETLNQAVTEHAAG